MIQRGRQQAIPHAEEYAVNQIAEKIVDQLYRNYVERARGGLLTETGELFQEMTGEDYHRIGPYQENPSRPDFVAERSDGEKQRTNQLSRATREQLFLSVRLSRIRSIEPPLPVILDGSVVNFDPPHRRRTAQILGELAERNQIFLLTSHPELIEFIDETNHDFSPWFISVEHRFESHDSPGKLIEKLNG